MKVVSSNDLKKAGLKAKRPGESPGKQSAPETGAEQITVLRQLKASIDAWINELEAVVQVGLTKIDTGLTQID